MIYIFEISLKSDSIYKSIDCFLFEKLMNFDEFASLFKLFEISLSGCPM